nr:RecName: Full=Venom peptide Ocy4 [Opisthacanthus cayaporum]
NRTFKTNTKCHVKNQCNFLCQ